MNSIFVRVPSEPRAWQDLSESLKNNIKDLSQKLSSHKTNQTRLCMEELASMKKQCESIIESSKSIHSEIKTMISEAKEINELIYKKEEWWIQQGEFERQESRNL